MPKGDVCQRVTFSYCYRPSLLTQTFPVAILLVHGMLNYPKSSLVLVRLSIRTCRLAIHTSGLFTTLGVHVLPSHMALFRISRFIHLYRTSIAASRVPESLGLTWRSRLPGSMFQ